MLGADGGGGRTRLVALVEHTGVGEAGGEGAHRPVVEPGHHGEHRGAVDAAGKEHTVRNVRALVQHHALGEDGIEPRQRIALVDGEGRTSGQRRAPQPVDDPAALDDDGLARQYALDTGEDRLAPGGELDLHQLVAHVANELAIGEAGGNERGRLGGEGETRCRLDIVERLDAEGIARQHEASGGGIVQRDCVHAAQMRGEAEPVTAIEVERRLAIRGRREGGGLERRTQLDVVVDLAIGDEGGAAGLVKRLVTGLQIDDGEPRLDDADIARAVMTIAVGAAMMQRRTHHLKESRRRRRPVQTHDAGDTAHQLVTAAKKSW